MSDDVFIKLIDGIGNPFLLTLALIVSILVVAFKSKIYNHTRKMLGLVFGVKETKIIKSLKYHDVFNSLDRVVYEVKLQKYYTDKEYDAVKTRMCYDFTKQKSITCGKFMVEFIKIDGIDSMKADKLKNIIIDLQHDMHIEYISRITDLWRIKGIKEEDVKHIVYLFEKFRYEVVSSFAHRIESIFGSTFHTTNYDKVLAVFEMWAMGIDLLPSSMQVTFEKLNGKFKDIKY